MFFLVAVLFTGVNGDLESTTTKTYDVEVPGSDPIRIVEGESLWQTTPTTNFEHRAYGGTTDGALQKFLTDYAESVRNQNQNKEMEGAEKAKSWDLMQYQKHNHPYEDKNKGWVSMEPVPWSVSKISKWQSKYKPSNQRPWDDYEAEEPQVPPSWNKPTTNNHDIYNKPTNNYDTYSKPTTSNYDIYNKPESKPIFSKPSAIYNQKVHLEYANRYQHKHDQNCNHPQEKYPQDGDIITDGLPANFPQQYESNRRHGTDLHHDAHPFSGEGDWVLLSTTKGYKYPQERQRSLQINPDSIGTHRGVRLTVLPPLKNSKVNMTTSHGGLLQVEATLQTVEQSRKQYTLKKDKMKKKKKPQGRFPKPVRQVAPPTVTTTRRNTGPDSSAVLAAVGAGMIPATMAMLVPMALGGRRKRHISSSSSSSTPKFQVTLPRNLY